VSQEECGANGEEDVRLLGCLSLERVGLDVDEAHPATVSPATADHGEHLQVEVHKYDEGKQTWQRLIMGTIFDYAACSTGTQAR
jgi:hypothetical protein